jgi:hypothetical protein
VGVNSRRRQAAYPTEADFGDAGASGSQTTASYATCSESRGSGGQATSMGVSKRCSSRDCGGDDGMLDERAPSKKQRGLFGWIGKFLHRR